jgi:hypothetical protein
LFSLLGDSDLFFFLIRFQACFTARGSQHLHTTFHEKKLDAAVYYFYSHP